jgi:hypothetical protein
MSSSLLLSSSKSSSSLTAIKGGGRADLSPDVEAAIVDYLRSHRDAKNPLLPKRNRITHSSYSSCPRQHEQDEQEGAEAEESPHDAAKNRQRFLKRLVQQYEQSTLSSKLNSLQPNSSTPTNNNNSSSSNGEVAASSLPATSGAAKNGKVRVDIVEAIYYNGNIQKNNNKSNTNNSSSSSSAALLWKPGSIKKTLVLERSTTVEELQKLAQAKLHLKKKPNCIFCVEKKKSSGSGSSASSGLEIPLVTNLAGLADGATIYVATTTVPPVPKRSSRNKTADAEKEEEEMVDDLRSSQAATGVLPMDPLEATKKTYYALKEQGKSSSSSSLLSNNHKSDNATISKERIVFAPHLDQLPPLTAERLQLPAASFRQVILKAMDKSRVVIICGETGCGKV